MEKLKFFDLSKKKAFITDQYKLVVKKGRNFAVATNPSGKESWRIIAKPK
jgi:hypothetical protein